MINPGINPGINPVIKKTKKLSRKKDTLSLLLSLSLAGCAADRSISSSTTTTPNALQDQQAYAATLTGARVNFHFSDFYSLTHPNTNTGCAGDAKSFYDPLVLNSSGTANKYADNLADSETTIRPTFISNVSVNLTDANAAVSTNLAQQCSLGSGTNSPPASNCSTFDFGAIGGLPTNMGGTLLFIGGLNSVNYAYTSNAVTVSCGPQSSTATSAINTCSANMFGLGIATLPATAAGTSYAPAISTSTGPISTWLKISDQTGYTGPTSAVGASAAFNRSLGQVVVFGGAAPLTGLTSTGLAQLNADTWVFNVSSQKWALVPAKPNTSSKITGFSDQVLNMAASAATGSVAGTILQTKMPGARSLFGYISVPGMALSKLSTSGTVATSAIDTTDRILTIGGVGPCGLGTCSDTHRFNPTFGPEYFETYGATTPIWSTNYASVPTDPSTLSHTQWIDSSPDTLISNSFNIDMTLIPTNNNTKTATYLGAGFPTATPTPGLVTLNTGDATTFGTPTTVATPPPTSINFGATYLVNKANGAGYPIVAGGFYGYSGNTAGVINNIGTNVAPRCTSTALTCGGDLQIGFRRGIATAETQASNFGLAANVRMDDPPEYKLAHENTPITWNHIGDVLTAGTGLPTATNQSTPWFGGSALLPGLDRSSNDIVYFGGTDCRSYITTGCGAQGALGLAGSGTQKNPGRYWSFTSNPRTTYNTTFPATASVPSLVVVANPPTNAGMAAARGVDALNQPLVVAWGGMISPSGTSTQYTGDQTGTIYYLYNSNTTAGSYTPAWGTYVAPSGARPPGYGNSQLVFSHITGKFYLFGGYDPVKQVNTSDTWELSLTTTTNSCAKSATATCNFTWKKLTDNGLTCNPDCPLARRSHRMVETNYNNITPTAEPTCTSAAAPCSFGIFMTGGTTDGTTTGNLGDRWMFDPTANAGTGHWQNVATFPPRTLGAMSNFDYYVQSSNTNVRRALLFGGETAMENPAMALSTNNSSTNYFVPPTLADTWMYDYVGQSWNRVRLLGQRYHSGFTQATGMSEWDARQASPMTSTDTQILSPPPLSGAMMVTRTVRKLTHTLNESSYSLPIPEVFLFGGRGKDGVLQPLTHVYKFCAGSTGEKPYSTSMTGTKIYSDATTAALQNSNDDATCDAYDSTTNVNSSAPTTDFVGTWIAKTAQAGTATPANLGSYQGAAAYDNTHDLILLYGGIMPTAAGAAVTDASGITAGGPTLGVVYEYTPPSKTTAANALSPTANPSATPATQHGVWNAIGSCSESPSVPVGRYGHSMGFDAGTQSLIVSGGYGSSGALLTQSFSSSDTTTIPEVWAATRIDQDTDVGIPSLNIPAITGTPCYYWRPISTFGNLAASAPTTGIANAASIFIPSSGYNTGYYSMFDSSCQGSGPVYSQDNSVNKLLVGGVYFDLDRTALKSRENLLLTLTILPLGQTNLAPNQSFLNNTESAIFKVHLVKTGQKGDGLRQVSQPRDFIYASTALYPQIAQSIAVLSQPTGYMRQEQIIVPIGIDPTIDRIQVQRYSGSAILIDAALTRMGGQK